MRTPLKTAVASWAPLFNIVVIVVVATITKHFSIAKKNLKKNKNQAWGTPSNFELSKLHHAAMLHMNLYLPRLFR